VTITEDASSSVRDTLFAAWRPLVQAARLH
jgi:hypothetical protein